MQRVCYTFLICSLLTVGLTACAMLPAADGRLTFVAVANQDDRIEWTVAEQTTTFEIYSPSGIGRATVRLIMRDYPARILLRFHLRGLEELRVTYDTTLITLSVPSTGEPVIQQQVTLAVGQGQMIAADSPYWMETKPVSAKPVSSATATPLLPDYIEVELPPHFLHTQQTAFSIAWIDFYR